MSTIKANTATHICEKVLNEEKLYNVENNILPSENAIADRLLTRGVELREVYEELHDKLHHHPFALNTFLGLVLSTAAFWSLDEISKARSARDDLNKVNQQIAKKAEELAELLGQRSELHNYSDFISNTHYHICHVIEAAAQEKNYLFTSWVQPRLKAIHCQFDLKYWPTLSDCMKEIASNAGAAVAEASSSLTAAATNSPRASLADFVKALFAAIEENSTQNCGRLPQGFKVTDNNLASVVNCSLDLNDEQLIDGAYVKRLRQRERSIQLSSEGR